VVVVLSHHPFHGGWLADEKDASSRLRSHAHILLSGHTHEAGALQVVTGGGGSLITITAGASHADAEVGQPPITTLLPREEEMVRGGTLYANVKG
jgi:hypothetical protein